MKQNILIYGAGSAGKLLLDEIQNQPGNTTNIIGFIDDNKPINTAIDDKKVLGGPKDVQKLVKEHSISEIIIAIPSAKGDVIRDFINICKSIKVNFKIVPQLIEILQKSRVNIEQIRNVQPEDLLGREMIKSDMQILEKMLHNKTIFVTGAAGSIGSELCRQLAHFDVKQIIFYDWWENGIYHLENEFTKQFPKITFSSIIGNVQDEEKVNFVLRKFKPSYIYHAAAFKHVPLMEKNPEEAIKNNVFGTEVLARAAIKNKVEKFIFISTDKAVNPTNIMGASKRIAEMLIKQLNKEGVTKFSSVRFGNVLASSGSVIPLFKKQITEGGPITVTHSKIIRYFMTTKEAVQLVLQSSYYGKGGELFVLDMGEPVKIIELAQSLIRLAGLIPNEDIEIKIIGLRPGEKLYEEKLTDAENMHCVKKDKLYIANENGNDTDITPALQSLKKIIDNHDDKELLQMIKKVVPSFHHQRDNT